MSAIFSRGILDSVLAIGFYDVEILDSVVFLQRGLIDSVAGSNVLKSQAAFGKWQLRSKFNSFFFSFSWMVSYMYSSRVSQRFEKS